MLGIKKIRKLSKKEKKILLSSIGTPTKSISGGGLIPDSSWSLTRRIAELEGEIKRLSDDFKKFIEREK